MISEKSNIKNYKELLFWKKSFVVTLLIIRLTRKFPKERVFLIVTDQIIRAASSVGANIAEGFGRYRGKEYERFLQISLGSSNEVEYWMLVIKELLPQYQQEIATIVEENNQTIRMLASSLKTLRGKREV